MATLLKWLVFLAGIAFVGWIASQTDLAAVWTDIVRLGVGGTVAVLVLFYAGYASDVAAWQCMIHSIPLNARGLGQMFIAHYFGEGVNNLMPLGGLGGEPVKAMVLKKRYGVTYREATASLVLAQVNNTLAEVPFIAVGLAIMFDRDILPPIVETAMQIGAVCVAGFIALVLVALHLRTLAALERRLGASRWGERLHRGLSNVRDIEQRLFTLVRHEPGRFTAAVGLSFITWLSGAVEVYLVLHLLGVPVTWQEAWLVEVAVVLARNATFFVPGHMGSQDGAMMLVVGAIAGSPELGLAMALIRRGRELFTSAIGLGIGAWIGLRPSAALLDQEQ